MRQYKRCKIGIFPKLKNERIKKVKSIYKSPFLCYNVVSKAKLQIKEKQKIYSK